MISKFIDSPDDKNMIFRKIRNGIEIGIAPMMYGYNIKAGIIGDNTYWLDYSAGVNPNEVEDLYSLIISIMNKRIDELTHTKDVRELAYLTFQDFPRQKTKPMCNDHECFMKINDLCGPEIISIKLPNLASKKVRHVLEFMPDHFDMINRMGGFDDLLGEN